MSDKSHSEQVALDTLAGIVELIGAYNTDWDEFDSLKSERDDWVSDHEDNYGVSTEAALEAWAFQHPEEATQLAEFTKTAGNYADKDAVETAVQEGHYGVQVRSAWVDQGTQISNDHLEEFQITLAGGGPAVRIMGELGEHGPTRAWLEHQDWGTPWTELVSRGTDAAAILEYSQLIVGER